MTWTRTRSLSPNGSPEQLATVRAADRDLRQSTVRGRQSAQDASCIFKLKHARAEPVASTLKEVYRDLLSSKDKEFSKDPKGEEKQSQNSGYVRVYGGIGADNNKDKKPTKVRQSFAGALSVGVDAVSNTVIISAQEEWIESVSQMVEYLDTAAEDHKDSVAYGHMAGSLRGPNLQYALNAMLLEQAKKKISDGAKPNANGAAAKPVANGSTNQEGG